MEIYQVAKLGFRLSLSLSSFWILGRQAESFLFLENNTRVYKEGISLELELDSESVLKELLSEIISSGSCFNFFDFFFLFFLEGLWVFEKY
jgi:hypothetical protein